jgi:hypothetical protein
MRIALWGAFDVEDCGRLAIRRVVEAELRRRLPGTVVTVFAPLGRLRPLALDGGRPAEPLATLDADAVTGLGKRFDCILVCAGDPLAAPDRAAGLWGDPAAAALLREPPAPGVAGCPVIRLELSGDTEQLPPPALLLARLLDARLLERRAGLLRLAGWAWGAERVLTVQGGAGLLGVVDDLAASLLPLVDAGAVAVQLAAAGALDGEEAFAEALEDALGSRCRRLPGVATLEDQAALIAGSTAFLGPPGVGLWLAAALGVPAASPAVRGGGRLLDRLGVMQPEPSALAAAMHGLLDPGAPRPRAAAAVARLDRHLDRLAGAIRSGSPEHRPPTDRARGLEALVLAHDARGRRLIAERRALQAALDGAVRDLEAELGDARDEADRLRSELAAARAANDRIVRSRTWRYSQPVRDTLARVRERRR